jgi:tetraprenyl-beta-curcumene synthase
MRTSSARNRGQLLARALRDALSLVGVGWVYWLRIYPQVRRELARWERLAHLIPDPVLRQHACEKLAGERLNPEAAALFAVLAPRRQRRRVVRLIVAYQVLYDYLDAVNEEPGCTFYANGLQLHRSLTEAVLLDTPVSDYYLHHPRRDDGGYMLALTRGCRRVVATLPSLASSAAVIYLATQRCAEGQSHNHAVLDRGAEPLVAWSLAQTPQRGDYLWWELAAGGISCLSIHALIASAADPRAGVAEACRVDTAYFPPICALSALLDSLADYHGDAGTTNHSFVAHYRDSAHAAERLVRITADATARISELRCAGRHGVILAGITAYYLSSASVSEGFPATAASHLMRQVGPVGTVMRAVMRARRRLYDGNTSQASSAGHASRATDAAWSQSCSSSASRAGAREATNPGTASTSSAAPMIVPMTASACVPDAENGAGKPLTTRR